MCSFGFLATLVAFFAASATSQQYAGEVIDTSLPNVPGSEIAFFKIPGVMDSNKNKAANLTLINYMSRGSDGKRLVGSKVQRAVIVIHGLNRDPGTYESNMLSALSGVTGDPNINKDSVAIMAPYFANGDDKRIGYPWTEGLTAGRGSTTSALVWKGSQWSAGGNNQYPYNSQTTSSYTVLDALVRYFDDRTLFPNMKQIVVAGHSLGAQTVHRYAALGQKLNTNSPVTYWVGNPNSYIWLSTDRPLSTASCPTYDYYRDGYTNFTEYPMTYGQSLVSQGRSAILANYNSKQIAYARGTQDSGDDSSTCAPFTTGGNRNERFFNFIKAFPISCPDPRGSNCDTVDLVNMGHDGGGMFSSPAGRARLFTDNFYGNGNRSYDFGYPRQQDGDDPFPDPALNSTSSSLNNNTYAGNLTYAGCWSDSGSSRTLPTQVYDNSANTIELCTSTCVSRGFSIAGLEFGSQCYCGNSMTSGAVKVIESSCVQPCAGNSSESCGGASRLSVFSKGTPYVLPPASNPETVGKFYYSNCYTETSARTLPAKTTSGSFMNLDYCAHFCSGYKYFGTEYGSECYCGNIINPLATIAPVGDCSMTCANNTIQYCGAGNRLSVFTNPDWVQPTGSSTSSAVGTPTAPGGASAGPACPAANNTVVTSNGLKFIVECGIDHAGGDLTSVSGVSFQQCIDACSVNSQCVDVSLSGSACYLKNAVGSAVNIPAVWGARLLKDGSSTTTSSSSSGVGSSSSQSGSTSSLSSSATSLSSSGTTTSSATSIPPSSTPSDISCPASDATTYTIPSGQSFIIECGIDHSGGDMGMKYVSSFQECINACDQTTGCVDVSLSGAACYLKSSVGPAANVPSVWGAKVVQTSVSSTSSGINSSSSSAQSSVSTTTLTSTEVSSSSSSASSSTSATPTAVSCPGSNGSLYPVASGNSFLIECGIDHQGGDLLGKDVKSFAECISLCDTTATCVDISLVGNACYLKNAVGPVVKLDYVWGARLVAASSLSSSLTTTASSSDVASSSPASSTAPSTSSSSSSSPSWVASSSSSSTIDPTTTTMSSTSSSSFVLASSSSGITQSSLTSSSSTSTVASSSSSSGSDSSVSSTSSSAFSSASTSQAGASSSSAVSSSSSTATLSPSSTSTSSSASGFTTSTSSTTVSSAASSSTAVLPAGFSYSGCFIDGSTRALPISAGVSTSQTQQQCAMACQTKGYKYSGTEYAEECWCGNSIPSSPAPESQCSMACKGDSTQKCGAGNRLSVVSDDSWKQTFFARPSFGAWNLLGCYTDSTAKRSLPSSVSLAAYGGSANATIANCVQACQAKGFAYCGAEYYSECYGSNVAPVTNLAGSDPLAAGCNFPCKGNSTESCGGSARIIVYSNAGS